ncbi:hypothetical protein C7212DRAFT_362299 [Tuber magnatum]|uniref:Uncharacterized protein n=1 Tax=Tuber magnatum TaxID=42249 RepID=A0A317SVW4_9PEZI|nr:hypothetical protein C7212DRAFT_362299 [Tuber magnatum]
MAGIRVWCEKVEKAGFATLIVYSQHEQFTHNEGQTAKPSIARLGSRKGMRTADSSCGLRVGINFVVPGMNRGDTPAFHRAIKKRSSTSRSRSRSVEFRYCGQGTVNRLASLQFDAPGAAAAEQWETGHRADNARANDGWRKSFSFLSLRCRIHSADERAKPNYRTGEGE